jgi:hypothetical protein
LLKLPRNGPRLTAVNAAGLTLPATAKSIWPICASLLNTGSGVLGHKFTKVLTKLEGCYIDSSPFLYLGHPIYQDKSI